MNSKAIKSIYMLLTLTLLIGLVPTLYKVSAQAKPSIFIDPAENIFYTDTTNVGDSFTVSVKTADWTDPGVFGYEFKVTYDNTMLEATVAEIPTGHWLTPSIKPSNFFPVDSGTIDQAAGTVSFAAALLAPELGKTGGGTLATVTFKIIAAPPTGSLTCEIGLSGVILVDPTATPISTDNYDIFPAVFTYAAPPPPYYLRVYPSSAAVGITGDAVSVDIQLINAKPEAKIVAVGFKLLYGVSSYPGALIGDEAVEGDFLKQFGETAFAAYFEKDLATGLDSVVGFVMILPPRTSYPEGNGTIATLTFRVSPLVPLPPVGTTIPLHFAEIQTQTIIMDEDANKLEMRPAQDGSITLTVLEDLNNDLVINIQDLAIWAIAFGATPDMTRYNIKADVNRDNIVNIIDGVLIAKNFGWHAQTIVKSTPPL